MGEGRASKNIVCFVSFNFVYSRTPLIRPPSESHWCGRIRGMVAREGFRYAELLQHRHTKYGRIRGMVVGEGGRSTGVLLYYVGNMLFCGMNIFNSR